MGILAWIGIGFVAGLVGRIVVRPGIQLGLFGTIAVGLIGSLVGGTVANVVADRGTDLAAAGIVGSILGTIGVLAALRLLPGGN